MGDKGQDEEMAKGDDTQLVKLVRIVVAFIIEEEEPANIILWALDGSIKQAVKEALLHVGAVCKTGPQLVGYAEEELSNWTKDEEMAKGGSSQWIKLFKIVVAFVTAEGEQSDKIMQAVAGPIKQSVKVALPQVGAVSKTGPQIVGYMEEDLGKWDKNLSIVGLSIDLGAG